MQSVFSKPAAPTALAGASVRFLNLHEYQAQALMREAGINVPFGKEAHSVEEVRAIAEEMGQAGHRDIVIKAQVHAGGRGKGHFTSGLVGGVHVCDICFGVDELVHKTSQMLGYRLKTKQTGPSGAPVNTVLLTERMYSRRELYVAFVMDRANQGISLVASTHGGVNIEEVAEEDPESIIKVAIGIKEGLTRDMAMEVATKLGFHHNASDAAEQLMAMYRFYVRNDCTQFEINPFIETPEGKVYCLDAKVNFDSNAAFRHPKIFALQDHSQEDPREVRAAEFDLNYIALEGNVGCLVNGAGLAMATMDVIKLKNGEPANFLDVGGSASEQQVYEALRIMAEDPKVHAILVNIFGGIMRNDVIAAGLINAVNKLNLRKPIIVRLKGTNVEQALEMIEKSGLRFITADDLNEAAEKAVHIATIAERAKQINVNIRFD